MEAVAAERSESNSILMPRMSGDPSLDPYGIEKIEPNPAGAESLKQIVHEFFGHQIKRYILGQVLSTESEATGLGSGVADLHQQSLSDIVNYDAANLEETIGKETVKPIKDFNFPKARNINVKFKIDTESPEAQKKLEAAERAWNMGAKIKASDVMDLIGFSMPTAEDEVLQNPSMMQQSRLWEQTHQPQGGAQAMGFDPAQDGQQEQSALPEDMSPEDLFGPLLSQGGEEGQGEESAQQYSKKRYAVGAQGSRVGAMKTENGVTYRLNENFRWERLDKDQPGANGGAASPGVAPEQADDQPAPIGFKTAKGSTYTWDAEGRNTQRDKSYHPEHGESETGLKEKSHRTIFVDREAAQAISDHLELGKKGEGQFKASFRPEGDHAVLEVDEGDGKGKVEVGRVPYTKHPAMGAHPVEFFKDGVHLGNEITEVHHAEAAPAAGQPKQDASPQPQPEGQDDGSPESPEQSTDQPKAEQQALDFDKRHATVEKHLGTINQDAAGIMRAFHASPEYQQSGTSVSTQVAPEQAKAVYEWMQGRKDQWAGPGKVVNLENYIPGALGFSSKAGALVIAPDGKGGWKTSYTVQTRLVAQAAGIEQAGPAKDHTAVKTGGKAGPNEETLDAPKQVDASGDTSIASNDQPTVTEPANEEAPVERTEPAAAPPAPAQAAPQAQASQPSSDPLDSGNLGELLQKATAAGHGRLAGNLKALQEAKQLSEHQMAKADKKAFGSLSGIIGSLKDNITNDPQFKALTNPEHSAEVHDAIADAAKELGVSEQPKVEQSEQPAPSAQAEPWQTKRSDFSNPAQHKQHVKDAIKAGKQVPPEVLADYPELQPRSDEPGDSRVGGAPVVQPKQPKPDAPASRKREHIDWKAEATKHAEEHGLEPSDLHEAVQYLWEQKREQHLEREKAKAFARLRSGLNAGDIARFENAGKDHGSDHPKLRELDAVAREIAKEYPILGMGSGYEQEAGYDDTDYTAKLWDILREGKVNPPARHDSGLISEAAEFLKSQARSYMTPEQEAELMAIPFQKDRIAFMHKLYAKSRVDKALDAMFSSGMVRRDSSQLSELVERVNQAASETETDPSDAQKEAGNYRKGKCRLHGMEITIETPAGATRSGMDKDGKPWSVTMPWHYGYIRKTESEADGDHIDVFLGPDLDSEIVFVVDQNDAEGEKFDEHKCMIGWKSEADAKAAYLAAYSDGWKGFSAIKPMTLPEFGEWIYCGDTSKPATDG